MRPCCSLYLIIPALSEGTAKPQSNQQEDIMYELQCKHNTRGSHKHRWSCVDLSIRESDRTYVFHANNRTFSLKKSVTNKP